MITKPNPEILTGGAIVFRESKGKKQYLIVKIKDSKDWEIPKVIVRRGESSVRAVIRLTSEQCAMSARILEEVGRYSQNVVVNAKAVNQKYFYYLMMHRSGGDDILGFEDFTWVDLASATKKVTSKKEKEMLVSTKGVLKIWEKEKKHRIDEEEEEMAREAEEAEREEKEAEEEQ